MIDSNYYRTALCDAFKIVVERSDLSPRNLARATGLTEACISQVRSGTRKPNEDTIARVELALGCPGAIWEEATRILHEGAALAS